MTELDEALASYEEQGYVILRNVLGHSELEALQNETAAQIAAGPKREPASDFFTKTRVDGSESSSGSSS